MALSKKCDRCGKHYLQEEIIINDRKVNSLAVVDRELDNRSYSTRDIFDLCPACLASFSDWLILKD